MSTKVLNCAELCTHVKIAPYKYNGGQLFKAQKTGQKYCISLDWFEVTLSNPWLTIGEGEPAHIISLDNGNLVLERDQKRLNGTKHYQFVYNIHYYGQHYGHIMTVPRRNSILDPGLSQLKLENHILYQSGWTKDVQHIIDTLQTKIHSYTRSDIAVDGYGFLNDFSQLLAGNVRKVGKAKYSAEFSANSQIDGFYIGARSSAKSICGYNKSKNIEKTGKTYISDWWEKNGLVKHPSYEDVDRLELRLKAKEIKKLPSFDLSQLEDPAFLAGIMKAQFKGYYQFVENTGCTNISRQKKIEAIDWDFFHAVHIEKEKKVNKPSATWAVKRWATFEMSELIANLDKPVDLFDATKAKCYKKCKVYGIESWFERKATKWEYERENLLAFELQKQRQLARDGAYYLSPVY